jgi:hypothetical protein
MEQSIAVGVRKEWWSEENAEIFRRLAEPFRSNEEKTLEIKDKSGKVVRKSQYVTARTVMNRLDEVVGWTNWWDDYTPLENSVMCRLTIRLPNGETLTKMDAGGYAGMADSGDDDKSGYSDAFKRAGVKFGVARYLYRDGVAALRRPAFNVVLPEEDGTSETPASVPPPPWSPGQPTGLDEAARELRGAVGDLPTVEAELLDEAREQRRLQDTAEQEPEWEPVYATLRKEVERANSGWMADHPNGPEAMTWEEVVLHLAHVTSKRKLHSYNVAELSADSAIDVIEEIDRDKRVHKFMLQHLYHYVGEALKRARERAKPKGRRGPR